MARISTLPVGEAEGKTKSLYEAVQRQLGIVPNIFLTLGQAPAVLEAYLGQVSALAGGALSPDLREQIAVATAALNACDYCASAHTLLGKKAGVSEAELTANLALHSDNPHTQAVLTFVKAIVTQRGHIADSDLHAIRAANYSEEEIVEIIAHVGMNMFTNYFNHIAQTDIDFPLVETQKSKVA